MANLACCSKVRRSLVAGSPSTTEWLKPEVIASTAYHQTGMLTVAGEPVNPAAPKVLWGAATVAVAGVGLSRVGGGV